MGSFVEINGGPEEAETSVVEESIARVRPLLDIIDKLRTLGIENDIEIPQIAVIGDQSSGKSSVLEALSGVGFPRGLGLVTRCATQVRMKRSKNIGWKGYARVSWAEKQPEGSGELEKPEDVAKAIETLTEALVAKDESAQFSSVSIVIDIEAATVPDLTLIDLPGIIRTTTQGQSQHVIQQVDNLLAKYLGQERTIILAVVPANQDVATVDVLERANKCDPEGDRTIAVLTKLDLVDPGACSQVADVLRNMVKVIKLGYCAVKNRSARDLQDGMSLKEAKQMEKNFFNSHAEFSKVEDRSLFGIENLTEKLVRILATRIRAALPDMLAEINRSLSETNENLLKMGEKPPSTNIEQKAVYQKLMVIVARAFEQASLGDYNHRIFYNKPRDLLLYTRAYDAFIALQKMINSHEDLESEEQKAKLKGQLEECRGRDLSCFIPTQIFNAAVDEFVKHWPLHAMNVCDTVVRAAQDCIDAICKKVLHMYPDMQIKIANTGKDLIHALGAKASARIRASTNYERHPFTLNHKLVSDINKTRAEKYASSMVEALNVEHADSRESLERKAEMYLKQIPSDEQMVDEIVEVLKEYCELAKNRISDVVCMIVRTEILDVAAHDMLLPELLSSASDKLEDLFVVDVAMNQRRKRLEDKKQRLSAALDALKVAKLS